MTQQDSATFNNSLPRRKSTFSLATLLCVLTVCAVLSAWFVDHHRLAGRIAPSSKKTSTAYRLSNVSATLAAKELDEWLEPGTVIAETVSNSLIVTADETNRPRIESMIQYLDSTGFANGKAAAPKLGTKPLPITDTHSPADTLSTADEKRVNVR